MWRETRVRRETPCVARAQVVNGASMAALDYARDLETAQLISDFMSGGLLPNEELRARLEVRGGSGERFLGAIPGRDPWKKLLEEISGRDIWKRSLIEIPYRDPLQRSRDPLQRSRRNRVHFSPAPFPMPSLCQCGAEPAPSRLRAPHVRTTVPAGHSADPILATALSPSRRMRQAVRLSQRANSVSAELPKAARRFQSVELMPLCEAFRHLGLPEEWVDGFKESGGHYSQIRRALLACSRL